MRRSLRLRVVWMPAQRPCSGAAPAAASSVWLPLHPHSDARSALYLTPGPQRLSRVPAASPGVQRRHHAGAVTPQRRADTAPRLDLAPTLFLPGAPAHFGANSRRQRLRAQSESVHECSALSAFDPCRTACVAASAASTRSPVAPLPALLPCDADRGAADAARRWAADSGRAAERRSVRRRPCRRHGTAWERCRLPLQSLSPSAACAPSGLPSCIMRSICLFRCRLRWPAEAGTPDAAPRRKRTRRDARDVASPAQSTTRTFAARQPACWRGCCMLPPLGRWWRRAASFPPALPRKFGSVPRAQSCVSLHSCGAERRQAARLAPSAAALLPMRPAALPPAPRRGTSQVVRLSTMPSKRSSLGIPVRAAPCRCRCT
jgi:hypothetical protein